MNNRKNPRLTVGIVFAAFGGVETLVALFLLIAPAINNYIALGLFGHALIFGTIGTAMLLVNRNKNRLRDELIAGGCYEIGTVVSVDRNMRIQVNGRHPIFVVCHIERGGVIHEYRSDDLGYHPGLKPGDPIAVYLDPNDEKRYYVDVESASPTIVRH